jgi:PPOX class probable F420-dependent enzyme
METVRLAEGSCWERLTDATHGVLSTVHPERGVDPDPVVFTVLDRRIVVPVDTVKPKSSTRLQRLANLELDDRCSLLVDHYDDDWSQLWWVRVHGRGRAVTPTEEVLELLASRYPAYEAHGAIATTIEVTPAAITGWAAS